MMNTSRRFLDFSQIYKLTIGSSLRMEKLIAARRPRLFKAPPISLLVNHGFGLLQ